jgi:Retroviral aspartyl protease
MGMHVGGEQMKGKTLMWWMLMHTTIKALTKEQRESFTKMVMEDKDREFLKQRTGLTSVSPSLSIEHVQVAQIKKNTMTVDILISGESLGQKKIVETTTLLDTGAGEKFIDQNFIQNQKIETKELKYPIEVFNVDGTPNKQGTITKYTRLDLMINRQMWTHNLLVTGLEKQKIILGYPPLGTIENPIVVSNDEDDINSLFSHPSYHEARSTFTTPMLQLLHCQYCTNRCHFYFDCPQYICDHCLMHAPHHHESDCLNRWSRWL